MQITTIRKATIEDISAIQQLNNELFNYEIRNNFDNYLKDWALGGKANSYFKELIENQFVILAEIDKKAVGYLAGSIYNDDTFSYYDGKTAELENMFVLEDYRKYGIGSKLVNSFIKWCMKNEAKQVFVTASIKNDNAINFYQKQGFENLNLTLRKKL